MATANPFFLKQTQFYKVGFPVEVQKCIGEYLMKHERRTPTPTALAVNDALNWFPRDLGGPIEFAMAIFPIGCGVIPPLAFDMERRIYTVLSIFPRIGSRFDIDEDVDCIEWVLKIGARVGGDLLVEDVPAWLCIRVYDI